MVISEYFIIGYWWLLSAIILIAIGEYWWLLSAIILVVIGGYY
jgi:hypothetical protein